ncbi:dTDP-4-keto-6-deoxy-D-glucose epimerase [Thermobifida alba]|uniref:dTDP-4-keto-6-deoxy-D-glucose epimerase n=1 Tax=Thermobifida alba TaxID=53522 RepID=A0ABY4L345_THEAE|nr:dTDP-4-dehydrorhamnose 3,5-epimerase family protein [Thermobifida alba]UPT22078.1 dTDP-4-keto-6-deoxy-D-glucose epimerase [Thermobifida alba]
MRARRLGVEGVVEFTPTAFPDERGFFVSPLQESVFVEAVGHALFPVAQASYSVSRRGVVRGVHYTAAPPGMAKYVYCPQGRALDVVVDIRVGSPTFGRWESVELDRRGARALYIPAGVGHLFVALEDDTVMSYLLAGEYVAENEREISPFDPELALPIPEDISPILSKRDREAPSLAQAGEAGLLPEYEWCLAAEKRTGLLGGGERR